MSPPRFTHRAISLSLDELARWVFAGASALLVAWLTIRRIGGWFVLPLDPLTLTAIGWCGTLITWGLTCKPRPGSQLSAWPFARWMWSVAFPVAIALLASLPGETVAGIVGLWTPVLVGTAFALTRRPRLWTSSHSVPSSENHVSSEPTTLTAPEASPPTVDTAHDGAVSDGRRICQPLVDDGDDADDGDVIEQEWRRGTRSDGVPFCSGNVRITIPAGERSVCHHVVLSPPMDRPPRVELECTSGSPATAEVAMALVHGFRIDVTRAAASDDPLDAVVEFYAECGERDEQ